MNVESNEVFSTRRARTLIRARRAAPALPAVALTVALVAACGGKSDAPAAASAAAAKPAMPPMEVPVVIASPGEALLTKELSGRLQAWRTSQVRARVEGIVEARLFEEGSDVKAGMPLYRLDARTYRSAFNAAQADLAAAQAVVRRYRPLVEMKAVSQQELDSAEANLRQAEAAVSRAQLDLENTTVPAPISGRIGRSLVTEGALVGRGEATQLATIEQIDPIYVNFTQSSTELLALRDAIKSGRWKEAETARMELVLENGATYALPGKLLFSDLAVDPNTGAVSMRAEFPNPKKDLLPGMYVRVRYPQAKADHLISLPQRAVMLTQNGALVMVVGMDGKVAPRPVQLGGMSGNMWTITGGLQGGEQVMVEGVMKAPPGSTVKPVLWNPSAAPAQGQQPGQGQ